MQLGRKKTSERGKKKQQQRQGNGEMHYNCFMYEKEQFESVILDKYAFSA